MFRAAHRSSSGAVNCICSLWFIYCNKVKNFVYIYIYIYIRNTNVILFYGLCIIYIYNIYKEYQCNIILWTMYNIYEIFYLIAVYIPEAANTV